MSDLQSSIDSRGDDLVRLIGLDVGSTTSSALFATARILRNCVTGRREFGEVYPLFRSEPVFTPFRGDSLDEVALAAQLDAWIAAADLSPAEIVSGGTIVTGLAAQKKNAAAVARLVRERFGETLIATANDPGLESWLAFMGNCLELSRANPDVSFLNLDIGGGTTNLAWGQNGEVARVGCYLIGARHVRFDPGTYRVTGLSPFAKRLLPDLGIDARVGNEIHNADRDCLLEFYVNALEAIVSEDATNANKSRRGNLSRFLSPLEQIAFLPPCDVMPVITISGGVGELVYRRSRGEPLPATTAFGDLGIDLARRLCESPLLSKDLRTYLPVKLGRATVYGLTIHNTELSGSTVYLPHPTLLPLSDLPIVGRLTNSATDAELRAALDLARRCERGSCLQLELRATDHATIHSLGQRLARLLADSAFPPDRPLVLLLSHNVGKTLGHYATNWGRLPVQLITIDEVPTRRAHFASLGKLCDNLVSVSFFGMQ